MFTLPAGAAVAEDSSPRGELYCRTCAIPFETAEGYRVHFRQDWHRYNLKLKLKGKPPITEEEFELVGDDVSSISGSDSEDDSENSSMKKAAGNPKIVVENSIGQRMAIYRSLLHTKKVRR